MVIYETINLINGKRYIGKDTHNDNSYLGSGRVLSKAIKKYGIDKFKFEIIANDTIDNEQKYIIIYNKY